MKRVLFFILTIGVFCSQPAILRAEEGGALLKGGVSMDADLNTETQAMLDAEDSRHDGKMTALDSKESGLEDAHKSEMEAIDEQENLKGDAKERAKKEKTRSHERKMKDLERERGTEERVHKKRVGEILAKGKKLLSDAASAAGSAAQPARSEGGQDIPQRMMKLAGEMDRVATDIEDHAMKAGNRFFERMADSVLKGAESLAQDPEVPLGQMIDGIVTYLNNDHNKNDQMLYDAAVQAVDQMQNDPAGFLGDHAIDFAMSGAGAAAEIAGARAVGAAGAAGELGAAGKISQAENLAKTPLQQQLKTPPPRPRPLLSSYPSSPPPLQKPKTPPPPRQSPPRSSPSSGDAAQKQAIERQRQKQLQDAQKRQEQAKKALEETKQKQGSLQKQQAKTSLEKAKQKQDAQRRQQDAKKALDEANREQSALRKQQTEEMRQQQDAQKRQEQAKKALEKAKQDQEALRSQQAKNPPEKIRQQQEAQKRQEQAKNALEKVKRDQEALRSQQAKNAPEKIKKQQDAQRRQEQAKKDFEEIRKEQEALKRQEQTEKAAEKADQKKLQDAQRQEQKELEQAKKDYSAIQKELQETQVSEQVGQEQPIDETQPIDLSETRPMQRSELPEQQAQALEKAGKTLKGMAEIAQEFSTFDLKAGSAAPDFKKIFPKVKGDQGPVNFIRSIDKNAGNNNCFPVALAAAKRWKTGKPYIALDHNPHMPMRDSVSGKVSYVDVATDPEVFCKVLKENFGKGKARDPYYGGLEGLKAHQEGMPVEMKGVKTSKEREIRTSVYAGGKDSQGLVFVDGGEGTPGHVFNVRRNGSEVEFWDFQADPPVQILSFSENEVVMQCGIWKETSAIDWSRVFYYRLE